MATDNLQALFGGTMLPQDMQQELINQRAQQFAQLTPSQQLSTMGYKTGAAIGGGLAQAMGVDITDPAIKRMTELRKLSEGITPNAEGLAKLATILSEKGYQTEAAQAYQKSAELRKIEAETTSKTMERLTPEQKNAAGIADASGNARGTPEWTETYKTELSRLTAGSKGANIKEIGVAEGTREPVYFDAGTDTQFVMKSDPTTGKQVRVPFNGGVDRTTAKTDVRVDNKAAAAGAVEIAQLDAKRLAQAQAAADKAVEAAGILSQLEKTPQGISGAGADTRLAALRVFDSVGLTSSTDQKALANADKFNSLTGERTLSFIKQLGTNPTDTDREFAKTIGPAIQKGEKTNQDLINYLRKRAQETVGSARAMESHFYKNNYSLQGYQSPFMSNLEAPALNKMSAEDLAKAAGGKIVNGKFVKN